VVNVGQPLRLTIVARASVDISGLVLGYMIKDRLGQPIFGTNTHHLKRKIELMKKDQSLVFNFEFVANLGEGSYSIAVALHTLDSHINKNYEWRDLALQFNVINIDKSIFVGVAWLPPTLDYLE
jgi:lipopolysaccharide transport system ATP-binding protein